MSEFFGFLYSVFWFVLVPLGITLYFAISLCRYILAKKANKKAMGTFDYYALASRRLHLIVSAAMFLIVLSIAIGIILLSTVAIAFM
jgi:hypothetical protein